MKTVSRPSAACAGRWMNCTSAALPTQNLHQALLADADVCAARYHTRFLEHWLTRWPGDETVAGPVASLTGRTA
jgi:acetyl-CoA carboxylase biotin carboxylase subunit